MNLNSLLQPNICFSLFLLCFAGVAQSQKQFPSNTEMVNPIHKIDFTNGNSCPVRKQGGEPQMINGYQVFYGSRDGNRQVDPQVAVGGGYVLEASNSGLIIYSKEGEFKTGVSQKCFNNGIDPKLFFDIHNRSFVFDLWWYYDKEKTKPVNIAVSESENPLAGWNIYPVSRKEEVDGGGIGYSKKWIGYSYPGGEENTFIMRSADARAGKSATIYHFKGSLGHPIFTQDAIDELYFFALDDSSYTIRKIREDKSGNPYAEIVITKKHGLQYIDYPPPSPQPGTEQKVSSGDRNPKNLVMQNGSIWFSQAVNCNGRSAVQWLQINAKNGKIIQKGLIASETSNYIQTSIAVNKNNDVLIGFQEVSERLPISPRFCYRLNNDPLNSTRPIISIGEGKGSTEGQSWGDYSGGIIDGDDGQTLWSIQSKTNEKGKNESIIVRVPVRKN